MSKKLLFNQLERQIIIDFNSKKKSKGKFWAWWRSNIITDRFNILKAKRQLSRDIDALVKKLVK